MSQKSLSRFLDKIDFTDVCWLWIGAINSGGYGNFYLDGKWLIAHRVSYQWFIGEIPEGLEIDHLCREHACVNPEHLEPVIHLDNVRRGNAGLYERLKTTCSEGHLYDVKWGSRRCKQCRNRVNREWIKKKEKDNG